MRTFDSGRSSSSDTARALASSATWVRVQILPGDLPFADRAFESGAGLRESRGRESRIGFGGTLTFDPALNLRVQLFELGNGNVDLLAAASHARIGHRGGFEQLPSHPQEIGAFRTHLRICHCDTAVDPPEGVDRLADTQHRRIVQVISGKHRALAFRVVAEPEPTASDSAGCARCPRQSAWRRSALPGRQPRDGCAGSPGARPANRRHQLCNRRRRRSAQQPGYQERGVRMCGVVTRDRRLPGQEQIIEGAMTGSSPAAQGRQPVAPADGRYRRRRQCRGFLFTPRHPISPCQIAPPAIPTAAFAGLPHQPHAFELTFLHDDEAEHEAAALCPGR